MTDSDPKSEKVSQVSRRGMLKWAGALAAVGVVGVGLGFGGDILVRPSATSTSTQTATQISTRTATETQVSTATATQMQTETETLPPVTQTATQTNLSTVTQTNLSTATVTATKNSTQTVTQPAVTQTATQTVTTTSVQQPTTLSYVPPLSASVQTRVNQIMQDAINVGNGDTITYHSCQLNCMTTCLIKVHSNNGVLTRIEGDDTVNANLPREDVSSDSIMKGRLQERPCAAGVAWQGKVYSPNRLLYPMQEVGKKGDGKYVRITWTQALDAIYQQLVNTKNAYGPYSIWNHPLASWMGAGVTGWGENSYSGMVMSEYLSMGFVGAYSSANTASCQDIFNTKLILLFGRLPNVVEGQGGAYPLYLQLAKEAGIPFILLDPRYTVSHKALNAQWIPIKPGSDLALLLAMAFVLFDEKLYNQTAVNTWIEPNGFAMWQNYVLGLSDGVPKNPQWAEAICGVPAATIKALAELYAKSNPTKLFMPWEGTRPQSVSIHRTAIALQAMMGYLMVNGGSLPSEWGYMKNPWKPVSPGQPSVSYGAVNGSYSTPTLSATYKLQKAILLRSQLDSGQITTAQFNGAIGNAAGSPPPNIKMVCNVTNQICDRYGASERVMAMKQVFSYGSYWYMNNSARYMDIILPQVEITIEDPGTSRFYGSWDDLNNYWVFSQPAIQPQGESRPSTWVALMLAKRAGVDQQYNPALTAVLNKDEWDYTKWNNAITSANQAGYTAWATNSAIAPTNPPTWDNFVKNPVMRFDAVQAGPFQIYRDNKTNPFSYTASQKLEIYSSVLANPSSVANTPWTVSFLGGATGTSVTGTYAKVCLGTLGPGATPLPQWVDNVEHTFYDPNSKNFPLMIISPESYYRSHSCFFDNAMLNGDCYKHRVWMSVADAVARGIKDGDLVRVFSDVGELVIPAYVTSRILPGVIAIYHAGHYTPDSEKTTLMPDGIDRAGNMNFLIKDDQPGTMVNGPVIGGGPVEVQKF